MTTSLKKNVILRVAIPSPLRKLFDYLPPQNSVEQLPILPGTRVLVPFGNREAIGVITEIVSESKFYSKLKPVLEVLDEMPIFSPKMLELIIWASDYYHQPIGEIVNNALPTLLRQKRYNLNFLAASCEDKAMGYYRGGEAQLSPSGEVKNLIQDLVGNCLDLSYSKQAEAPITLNAYQKNAITSIKKHLNNFKTFLLNGVTGSGKTEVYLQVLTAIMVLNKQALVLIPEINLTPQTIERFAKRFPVKIAIFHSRMTPKERLLSWQMARAGSAAIVIGTRSAIFTQLKNPGIIVVDEEHDLSFKQQSGFRYSARDLAVVRGKLENIPVILGSATPSIESIYNVKKKRYIELNLPERAGEASHPVFHLVDMRNQKLINGIAENLIHQIDKHIKQGGQVLIFLNRRGFAPLLICHHCGWVAGCKHCDARLTIHKKHHHLRCHHCGAIAAIPQKCPNCSEEKLLMLGVGTERIEMALQELFPNSKITRIDRDTTKRKNSLKKILDDIHADKYQILVGTQMLAKGHHFPKVTMAAILNVDQCLFNSDFRASEHLAQLIIQVAGRAGRATMPGEVYLQTHNPHHRLLLDIINGGYMSFVNNCLAERQTADLPPYAYLALLQAESKKQGIAEKFLNLIKNKFYDRANHLVKVFGPVPTTMERKAGYFRFQLLLQSKKRNDLQQALNILLEVSEELKLPHTLRWFLDVDPMEI